MASGLLVGTAGLLRAYEGVTTLPIASATLNIGITLLPNSQFQLATLGEHLFLISIQLGSNTRDRGVRIRLYNVTLGSVAASSVVVAKGATSVGVDQTIFLPFTVADVNHVYELQISTDARRPNFVGIGTSRTAPSWDGDLRSQAEAGSVGPGTNDYLAKFVGPFSVGDSRWEDPGAGSHLPNGPIDMEDEELIRPEIRDYGMTTAQISGSANPQNLDMEQANVFDVEQTGNNTFAFLNPPLAGSYGKLILFLRDDGGGPHVPTFPGSVIWPGGAAPAYVSPAVYAFVTVNGGVTWYGMQGGSAFA